VKLAKAYGARILLDDAHGVGPLGATGRGTLEHFGLLDNGANEVDMVSGTFSKSLASLGGFIAGREDVIHYIEHVARPLIFSASCTPASTVAALTSLEILEKEPWRVDRLRQISKRVRTSLNGLGYDTMGSETPIIPVLIGEDIETFLFWKSLDERGVFANPVVPPATPPGKGLIRTSYMATHEDRDIDHVINVFTELADFDNADRCPQRPRLTSTCARGRPCRPRRVPRASRTTLSRPSRFRDAPSLGRQGTSFAQAPLLRARRSRNVAGATGGRTVGRIGATVNRLHNEVHDEKTGFFGFFECEDDPVVATLLFDTASDWLRARGMERVRGPASWSSNDEFGLYVGGDAGPPTFLMPWNPPWYAPLVEGAGFVEVVDLLAWRMWAARADLARWDRLATKIAEREGLVVRPIDMRRFEADVEHIRDLYADAWSRNWGFVPMTRARSSISWRRR
jgi:hypothetical protein